MNLEVTVWICGGVTMYNTYPVAGRAVVHLKIDTCSAFVCHFFYTFFFFFTALKRIHSKNLFARQRSSVWGGDPECWSRCCADSKGPSVGKLDLARATSQEDLDRPSEEVEVYFLLQSFCSHRGLNLLAVTWVLVCGAPCVCCMCTYVHRPVEGKSWDQAGISQPVFVAKSHFMYTKYKENSIFNLVFLEDFSFCFSKGGTWSMNFILLYHNHLAHKWARWPFIYFSCIFILYFAVVFFYLGGISSPESAATHY